MPETIIGSVLSGSLEAAAVLRWISDHPDQDPPHDSVLSCCSRSEFVAYFVSFLRNQIDGILQTNSGVLQALGQFSMSESLLAARAHHRSISDPTYETERAEASIARERRSHESPPRDRKRTTRKVKTKLFSDDKSRESLSSDESRLSIGVDRLALCSTPLKNGVNTSHPNVSFMSPVTPHSKSHERCDTPRLSHRQSRPQEKSCLGDYIITAQKSSKKKRNSNNKTVSDDSDIKVDLDLSNSDMFPEIGARKSNSLRSEKRRIKPNNIDESKKSISLNSFNSECFQQPSPLALEDNVMFKQQKLQPQELSQSFDAERNLLKQERQKLMEKFNTLNMSSSPKTPLKVMQRESLDKAQTYVEADASKVAYKQKLDMLADIYDCLLKNNLVLSINTEIYFLISIISSKQYEHDYLDVESNLNESTLQYYILRTIHNSTYFAVRCLWLQRSLLELILDKNSLKLLGENKKVRGFSGELAKCLLNWYGVRCEQGPPASPGPCRSTTQGGSVVVFNAETDCADNFPSTLSFHNFKKQRDMFYEIVRWYNESSASTPSAAAPRGGLRARIKALVAAGPAPANLAHLAVLFTGHLLSHCQYSQEDRLSKLTRRLTQPAAVNDPAHDKLFDANDALYKEMLLSCEHAGFRAHVRDALATELVALDATPLVPIDAKMPLQGGLELRAEYLSVCRSATTAAKFLALLLTLPYGAAGAADRATAASERVLENIVAMRKYYQPPIDLAGLIANAHRSSRLSLTVVWLSRFLSVVAAYDPPALRLPYYSALLRRLVALYRGAEAEAGSAGAAVLVRWSLGALFALPAFPQQLFHESLGASAGADAGGRDARGSLDALALCDADVLAELSPSARELQAALAGLARPRAGAARHVTPLRVAPLPAGRRTTRDQELQSRLEVELLRAAPASARRVLELVTERVTSHATRTLNRQLRAAREGARAAVADVARGHTGDHASLASAAEQAFAARLTATRASALAAAAGSARPLAASALQALLPPGACAPAFAALCLRAVRAKLQQWAQHAWPQPGALAQEVESELRALRADAAGAGASLGALPPPSPLALSSPLPPLTPRADAPAGAVSIVSVAECLIQLKEQVCLALEGQPTPSVASILCACASCCAPSNAACRPPALKALLQLSTELCVAIAAMCPVDLTDDLLASFEALWEACSPELRSIPPLSSAPPPPVCDAIDERSTLMAEKEERAPTPQSDDEGPPKVANFIISTTPAPVHIEASATSAGASTLVEDSASGLFSRVVCARNIALLAASPRGEASWAALGRLLARLVKRGFLKESALTDSCLKLYRRDWPQKVSTGMAVLVQAVTSSLRGSGAGGQLALCVGLLADFAADDAHNGHDGLDALHLLPHAQRGDLNERKHCTEKTS